MSFSGSIEALTIFLKYGDVSHPTNCVYDKLIVCVDPSVVSPEDITRLEELGFTADTSEDCFYSVKYGSV